MIVVLEGEGGRSPTLREGVRRRKRDDLLLESETGNQECTFHKNSGTRRAILQKIFGIRHVNFQKKVVDNQLLFARI
jgi:hypothetical protein